MTHLSFVTVILLFALLAPGAGAQPLAPRTPTAGEDAQAPRTSPASPRVESPTPPPAATEGHDDNPSPNDGLSGNANESVAAEDGDYRDGDGRNDDTDSIGQSNGSDEEAARAAFRRGDQLFLEGDYEGAVQAFQEAYAASGRIEMLFNLANAHERLGNYSEAAVALRGYIPHAPARQREALERRLERFERRAKQARATPPPPPASEQAPQGSTILVQRAAGIGLIGLGVASLAVGTGFALSALDARSSLGGQCQEGAAGRLCPLAAEPLLARDQSHSLVADVAFVAGALAGAVGIVLVLDSADDGKEAHVGLGPSSAFLGGTF